jgi:hypothetical protein
MREILAGLKNTIYTLVYNCFNTSPVSLAQILPIIIS